MAAVWFGVATSASAAQVQLALKSPDGRPVADAVVSFMPASGVTGAALRVDGGVVKSVI